MKKFKKATSVLLASTLAISVLASCSSSEPTTTTGDTTSGEQTTTDVVEKSKLVYGLGANPKTLDPTLNTAVDGSIVIYNLFEGLTEYNASTNVTSPAGASEWTVSDDGLTYTFTLRDDAKWTDGQPVVADDYAYAIRRAVDPATGCEYAYQMYYLKNAVDINAGNADLSTLGVEVVDDKTLVLTLEEPTPYFLQLTDFPTYYPIRQDIVEANGDAWATSPDTYVSNGRYVMKEWSLNDKIILEKNVDYWDADATKLEILDIRLLDDEVSGYASFKSGDFDVQDNIPLPEIPAAMAEGVGVAYEQLGTSFYVINVDPNANQDPEVVKALQNPLVREALSVAIDRQSIVDNVRMMGEVPATSFVPKSLMDPSGNVFSDDYFSPTADKEKALALLAEAGYPNAEGLPVIPVAYNTSETNAAIAQTLQAFWSEIGVETKLSNEEWATFQTTRQAGDFAIARHGWSGDYVDPMTFLEMFITDGGMNVQSYSNPEYDALIQGSKSETDPVKRYEMLDKAEEILINDYSLLPLYYSVEVKAVKPYVKGMEVSPLGGIRFYNVTLEK